MRFSFLCFLTFGAIVLAPPAHAQSDQILACGTPNEPLLKTDDNFTVCDIYSRQFAYIESRNEFREMIEERRKNYIKPQLDLQEIYKRDLDAYHNSIGSE